MNEFARLYRDHTNVLNSLLSNTCRLIVSKDEIYSIMSIDLHCNTAWFLVKSVPNREEERFEYEILSYRIDNSSHNAMEKLREIAKEFGIEWKEN